MPRYKLTLEYVGTPFVGWQRQNNGLSVQKVLEDAATALDERKVASAAAGRTDAGVHALAMVVHIDLHKDLPAGTVRDAINHHLKQYPVVVIEAERADDDFHARFSCFRRHYLYRLVGQRSPLALKKGRVWRLPYELDASAMRDAVDCLVGRHDFTTFRSVQCQAKSPVKTLETMTVTVDGEEIHVRCSAPSFLHNQVRSFIGTLERVGAGRWTPDQVRQALEARDRQACGPVAPPHGLYFVRAEYPEA